MPRLVLAYSFVLAALLLVVDLGGLERLAWRVHELPYLDKSLHFVMFGLLALLVNGVLLRHRQWSLIRTFATGSILVLIVATVEECSNVLTAYRKCSLADLAANYLGVVCLGILPLVAWWVMVRPSASEAILDE
jgi:hypothetical protein